MTRPEITQELSERLEKKINPNNDTRIYYAKEVTFDYAADAKRVDFVLFKPQNNSIGGIEKGDFYCYEIKSSVEDFKSKNGHNMLGDFNYYVMPEDVFTAVKEQVPWSVGVLCPDRFSLKTVKNARRVSRNRATSEMLLMMFRSANRENIKRRRT